MADLTTVAAVKAFAGVTGTGADPTIGGLVTAVSALMHGIVGHDFEGTPIVAEKHGPVFRDVVLEKPAASIQEVRRGTNVLVDGTDYALDGDRVLVRLDGSYRTAWVLKPWELEVDYTPVSVVPDDLELAARMATAFTWKQSAENGGGARLGLSAQANTDAGTADYFAQTLRALPFVNETLRRYRRVA